MNLLSIAEKSENWAREYLERIRWPDGPRCPYCVDAECMRLKGKSTPAGTLKCKKCRRKFTVRVGTIFERSHIQLKKWVMAFYLLTTSKKGVSAKQLQRQLGLGSYKTAWHMAHRIRHAMSSEAMSKMLGGQGWVVEADETYVPVDEGPGGYRRGKGAKRKVGRNTVFNAPVVGLVERGKGGRIKARVVADVTAKTLQGFAKENVRKETEMHTDEWSSYRGLDKHFKGHLTIEHGAGQYAFMGITTNTIESFWSLLKTGITGSFHHVSREHLQRYVDEFVWRWSHRDKEPEQLTAAAIALTEGRRLMYREPRERSI